MPDSIILIGPWRAGKSTLGRLLADAVGAPFCDLPSKVADYWLPAGYDREAFRRISQEEGVEAVLRYLAPFEVETLERGLRVHSGSVIDLGAGHSVYDDPAQFARAGELLAPYSNVVLLMPSPDLEESVTILRQRSGFIRNGIAANRFFLLHLLNSGLAKHTVYTIGKTPEQSRDEILRLVSSGTAWLC